MNREQVREGRLLAALSLAGLIIGIGLIGLAKDRLLVSERYRIGPVALEMGPLPEQLREHRDRILEGQPLLAGPRSIFDSALPGEVRAALLKRPWIRAVTGFRRRLPNGIQVEVHLRLPRAVVCVGIERLAVDLEGVVLESDTSFAPPACPEIHLPGEEVRSVPGDGFVFRRASVLEALAVLADIDAVCLQGHAALETFRIERVIVGMQGVPRREGASDIRLVLDNGVHLIWGRSSRSPLHVFEPPVERKLDHLSRVLRTYPGLLGLARIDLRTSDPMVYMRTS